MKTRKPTPAKETTLHELAGLIDIGLPEDGSFEVRPGVFFHRQSVTYEAVHMVTEPSFCMMAQGRKDLILGEETFHYDPAHYLITTIHLPVVGMVVEATPQQPYLGFQLMLDPQIVTSVMMEASVSPVESPVKGVDVSRVDDQMLDATLRLVRLTLTPADYAVLAPLVIREITYRLLKGAQGNRLQHLACYGGQTHRMTRAVQFLQHNYSKPLRISDLAGELGMSTSSFHTHFKAATAMTPIQYQKKLRLQEARRLMQMGDVNAAEAGFQVGYEDASQFSREYKRQFGRPPRQDVALMREAVGG